MQSPYKFPHEEHPTHFKYAYVPNYRIYHRCYHWCREHIKQFWRADGDPNTQIYRFVFFDKFDHMKFLLQWSNEVIDV